MSAAIIPISPDQLTPDVLTALLVDAGHPADVRGVTYTAVGTGQMAGSYRLRLDLAAGDVPTTMIAKLATGDLPQRQFASGAFRNEVDFYSDFAARLHVPLPECYASAISVDGTEFVLLLQDMGDAVQGDQIAGCTPEQARSVAVAAAGLHAPTWDDPALLQRFPLPTADDRELMESVLAPMTDVFRERFTPDAAESGVLDWLVATAGDWLIAARGHTALIHGDMRIDNVLFGSDGAVTVIDWQTITTGSPMRDLAFLLASSLEVDDRRRHERAIVEAYRQALLAAGIDGYSAEQCWDDYVADLLQAPLIVVFGAGAATPTERGDAMFATMLRRATVAITDHSPDLMP